MSRSKRFRKATPAPTRSATQTMPNPDYLRIITCNLQWGTPAEGWPDIQKANSRTGAFIRGLGGTLPQFVQIGFGQYSHPAD